MKKVISLVLAALLALSLAPIVYADELSCPYTGAPVKLRGYAADLNMTGAPDCPVALVYKEAVGNIDVDWELVTFDAGFDTKARLYFNSGDIPDIVWFRSPEIIQDYGTSGLFLDFNQYKELTPNWNAAVAQRPGLLMYQTLDGKQLTMHDVLDDYPSESFFANTALLKEYGLKAPTNLEEFEAVCDALLEADPTITPFHTFWKLSYYSGIFSSLIDAKRGLYYDLDAKVWKHAMLEEDSNYKQLIELLAKYYKKGYFNPEFTTMSDEQTKNLIETGKWGLTFTYFEQMNDWYSVPRSENLPFEYDAILPPVAEGVKPSVSCGYVSDSPYWCFAISAKTAHPELCVSWCDTMLSDKVATAFQWGIEGVSYEVDADGNKHWIQSFLDKGSQAKLDLGVWNINGPRFITKRDDLSNMMTESPKIQETRRYIAEALINGEVTSYYYPGSPTLSDDALDEFSQISAAIKTVIDQNEALFVLGMRSLDEWDDYIAEVKSVGDVARLVQLYNEGVQKPERVQADGRVYLKP